MGTKRRQILHFEDKEKISFSKLNFGGKKGKSHLTGELCCSKMSSSSLRDILILFKFWQNLWAADHFLNGRHSCSYCQHRSKLHCIKQNCSGSRLKKKNDPGFYRRPFLLPLGLWEQQKYGVHSWKQFGDRRPWRGCHHWPATNQDLSLPSPQNKAIRTFLNIRQCRQHSYGANLVINRRLFSGDHRAEDLKSGLPEKI